MKKQLNLTSRSSLAALAVGVLCFSGSAFAADAKKEADMMQLDKKDKDFMMEAAQGGQREVDAGKLAVEKGQSADVKMLGKAMVADHTKAGNQLKGLAKKKGVTLDSTHKLVKLGDKDFDNAWLAQMVKDHEKTIALFEDEAKNGKDGDTKNWANKTLPTLKKHLKMVQDAQGKMKKA